VTKFHVTDRDPTPNHDENHEYEAGCLWVNMETGHVFLLVHPNQTAAYWHRITYGDLELVAKTGKFADLIDRPKLGQAASADFGETNLHAARGDDKRIVGALQRDQALADLDPEKARKNLGISKAGAGVIGQPDIPHMRQALGVDDALNLERAVSMFQPRSPNADRIATVELGVIGAAVMRAKDPVEAQQALALVPGQNVQPFSPGLTRAKGTTKFGERLITADTREGAYDVLGLVPIFKAMEREIERLKKRVAELETKK